MKEPSEAANALTGVAPYSLVFSRTSSGDMILSEREESLCRLYRAGSLVFLFLSSLFVVSGVLFLMVNRLPPVQILLPVGLGAPFVIWYTVKHIHRWRYYRSAVRQLVVKSSENGGRCIELSVQYKGATVWARAACDKDVRLVIRNVRVAPRPRARVWKNYVAVVLEVVDKSLVLAVCPDASAAEAYLKEVFGIFPNVQLCHREEVELMGTWRL